MDILLNKLLNYRKLGQVSSEQLYFHYQINVH